MKIKIISLNIANALTDEQTEYRLGLRLQQIADLIKSTSADVVHLQELRRCQSKDKSTILTSYDIATFFAKETSLEIAGVFVLNPSDYAFARCTLYNPNRLFPLQSFGKWCSDTPNFPSGLTNPSSDLSDNVKKRIGFGVGAQFTRFAEVLNRNNALIGPHTFWTVNVHYPIPLQYKLYTNKYLIELVKILCENKLAIITGDFNTFIDCGYDQQMNQLREHFLEASYHIPETFTSFPHDEVAKSRGAPISSKLDHIFVYNEKLINAIECDVIDTKKSRESDHYVLVANVDIC